MRKLSVLLPAVAILLVLLATSAPAQMPTQTQTQMQMRPEYLDVYMVKVKPEKMADFEVIAKKMVDANRRNNGDRWIAWGTAYGEQNTIYFMSPRMNYADIQKGFEVFMGALAKSYGQDGAKRLMHDFDACATTERAEVRRIRWDLSSAVTDMATVERLVGGARWRWTTEVQVRPGRMNEAEELVQITKQAHEKADPNYVRLIEESVAGTEGSILYITTLQPSLSALDVKQPEMKTLLGEQGYERVMNGIREITVAFTNRITRPMPELSNAPEEIAQVAPDFWTPKAELATTRPRTMPRKRRAEAGAEARR